MKTILVIGASGFIGGRVTKALLADGRSVRCLARDPAKLADLAGLGCEIVKGDMSDLESLRRALNSVSAVYVAIHTLSPQPASKAGDRFMAVELDGLSNIVEACREQGTPRLIYVTSLGTDANSRSEWLRERARAEQMVLTSGLHTTVIRPGMIVGTGGRGFETLVKHAQKTFAIGLGGDRAIRTISVNDLVGYLVALLEMPESYGNAYDVGNEDVLSNREMTAVIAGLLGRKPPTRLSIPRSHLALFAPLIERMGKWPRASVRGFLDTSEANMVGDTEPIRAIVPRKLATFREAAKATFHDAGIIVAK